MALLPNWTQHLGFVLCAICVFQSAADSSERDDTCVLQTHRSHHRLERASTEKHVPIERTNLVYIKLPKAASSTSAGVNRRIAAHHNLSGVFTDEKWIADNGEPGAWSDHGMLSLPPSSQIITIGEITTARVEALQMPTFLWTMIRDPAERAMSDFYWTFSKKGSNQTEPSTSYKISYLQKVSNFMFEYIRPSFFSDVEDVIQMYDFLGVTERFDETVVALAATLHIPLSDVLYIPSKSFKNTAAGMRTMSGNQSYQRPALEDEPKVVQQFLKNQFRKANALDYQLYEYANKNLSAKMAVMRLDQPIVAFKSALAQVQDACTPAGLNSSYLGDLMKCYSRDQGCGYECIDQKSNNLTESLGVP